MMRRFVRGLFFLGLLAAIPLSYYLYRAYSDANRLEAVLMELDRTEPGWRLADIQRRIINIPDEHNSALIIKGLKFAVPAAIVDEFDLAPNVVLTPRLAAAIKEYLDGVEPALGQARRLARMPDGRFTFTISNDFISTLLPHVQQVREVALGLRVAALWQAQQGNFEQAAQDVQAAVNAARTLRHEPFLISQLVRNSVTQEACATMERIVAQGQPAAMLLAQAQELFHQEQVIDGWFEAMAGERAGMHELFDHIETGKVPAQLIRGMMGGRRRWHDDISDHFSGLTARVSHIWMLEHFTAALAARDLPAKERRERLAELRAQVDDAPILARELFTPPFRDTYEGFLRTQAKLNATVAGLAAERFRQKHRRWPKSLDELVPEFLEKTPLDPYDGEPLRFRVAKDGVVVYSVGPDGNFDGTGRDAPLPPGDLRPAHEFRLWDVNQRRK